MHAHLSKIKLGVAIAAVIALVPTTALATHVFSDVDDGRFFAGPVKWAFDNGITTGTTATTFSPDRGVTRGESVTFLNRYDTNIVQPALSELEGDIATNTAGRTTNAAGIAALDTAQAFAVTERGATNVVLTATVLAPTASVTVALTAPVDGHVTVNSTASVFHSGADGSDVFCMIAESTAIPTFASTSDAVAAESAQWFEKSGSSDDGSLSGTRTFAITGGTTVDYVLACGENNDGGWVRGSNLTAIFTPAP